MINRFFALLKREWLEHNSLWRVPAILIGLAVLVRLSLVFGNLATDVDVPEQFQIDEIVGSAVDAAIGKGLNMMNAIIVFTLVIVACFYALNCLFSERQDQSVLFWRSLPVSDTQTIISKLVVALIVIPLLILVCQVVIAIIFLDTSSANYLGHYFGQFLNTLSKLVLWVLLPTIAWCLFCSAAADRSPFLLALFAPLAVIAVDWLFLDGVINNWLSLNRLIGFKDFSIATLVSGLGLSALFIVLAINKRRQRI